MRIERLWKNKKFKIGECAKFCFVTVKTLRGFGAYPVQRVALGGDGGLHRASRRLRQVRRHDDGGIQVHLRAVTKQRYLPPRGVASLQRRRVDGDDAGDLFGELLHVALRHVASHGLADEDGAFDVLFSKYLV